jgi:hypothetical protein
MTSIKFAEFSSYNSLNRIIQQAVVSGLSMCMQNAIIQVKFGDEGKISIRSDIAKSLWSS